MNEDELEVHFICAAITGILMSGGMSDPSLIALHAAEVGTKTTEAYKKILIKKSEVLHAMSKKGVI